jgi:RND family efflux transporter MFP subunit
MKILKKISKGLFSFVKKRWKLLAILLVVAAIVAYFVNKRSIANQPVLTFEHPVYEDLVKTLEVSGYIDASEKAVLRFAAGGKLVYLGAKEGDYLKKWQTIASIDQRDLQKRLEKDLNLYMKERWDWDQQLDDIKDRTIDKEESRGVDKNQWDLENTVIDVELRDISITDSYMAAPFDGIVVKTPTNVTGVSLLSTDTFEMVNPNTLFFSGEVDEEDISQVKAGQKALLTLDAYPDHDVETYVEYISYKSKETSGGTVFEVEFPIWSEQTLERFRLGMNGDIKIILQTKENVLSIPLIATKEKEDGVYVDVKIDDQTTEERKIEIGLETDEKIEVLNGLTESDQILIPE